jgi:hypothetical protein
MEGSNNLIPSNIRKDITILGVTGTLEEIEEKTCDCVVKNYNGPISLLPPGGAKDGQLVYSIEDEKVYKNVEQKEWAELITSVVPLVYSLPTDFSTFKEYDKVCIKNELDKYDVYEARYNELKPMDGLSWKKMKYPILVKKQVKPKHSWQDISLNEEELQKYDGMSVVTV